MKKSLIFWLAAVTCAALFLVGCEQEAKTEYVTQKEVDVIHVDVVVTDDTGLAAALLDDDYKVIEVDASSTVTLSTVTEIPAGKTVIIRGGSVTPASGGLTIKGVVYVELEGSLVAAAATKVIVTDGVLYVSRGALSVDAAASVNNGAESPATVLGTGKVGIAGGTLKYTAATDLDTAAKIGTALGYVTSGTLDIGSSTLKPSQIAGVTGISPTKRLIATATGDDSATATALIIPAGLDLTASSETFAKIPTLTVNGKLTASSATLAAATSVSIGNGGILNIGASTALTFGAETAVTSAGTGKIVSTTATATVLQALLSKAGATLNIEQGGAVTLTAATTVKAGTVLVLGASGSLTADNTAAKALTVAGTVVLNGGTLATSMAADTSGDNPAINITGTGSIVAGNVVISGAGSLYDTTSSTAKAITITNAEGFVGAVNGLITLKGETTINAGNGKVILAVDGGGTSDTGTFQSAASNGQLTVTADEDSATVALDDGTAVAAALTIGEKGSLTVAAGGIIAIKAVASTLLSTSSESTAKFVIAAGAKLAVDSTATGETAAFTTSSGAFSNTGTFATDSVGTYVGDSSGKWTKQ